MQGQLPIPLSYYHDFSINGFGDECELLSNVTKNRVRYVKTVFDPVYC